MTNRVAITGCGVVCALGGSFTQLTSALLGGQSGIRLVSTGTNARPGVAAFPVVEGEASDLTPTERSLLDPVTRYALAAAQEAIDQSGALEDTAVCRDTAVYMGTAVGGAFTIDDAYRDIWYHGTLPKPLALVSAMTNAPASHVSMRFGLKGPNVTYAVACASSAIAIGEAFQAIRAGRIGCAIAGGAEACVTPGVLRAWHSMRLLASVDRHMPDQSCRPFSRDRTGTVLGEGAAILVMENLDAALARGATVLCELVGYGTNSDASHPCIPSVEGQANAMTLALADAGLAPTDINYLNAHGTATKAGDITETRSIRRAFGAHADALAVSSTKASHGHVLGASGALELAVCIAAIRERFLPATMHLRERDAECDLDFVPNQPRTGVEVRCVMSNSFAFGGSNAVLIATRSG